MPLLAVPLVLLLAAAGAKAAPPTPAGALSFSELLEGGDGPLRPSEKLRSLAGQRVRLVGFMARMEDPPEGSFWLVPRPVTCDESGGGVGDLPPDAVRVVVRSAAGRPVAFVPGALAVTGRLEVGNVVDVDGIVSALRIVLDRPQDLRPRRARTAAAAPPSPSPSTTQEVSR